MEIRVDGEREIENVIGQVGLWHNDWHETEDGMQYENVRLKDGRNARIYYHRMSALAITFSLYREYTSHIIIEDGCNDG